MKSGIKKFFILFCILMTFSFFPVLAAETTDNFIQNGSGSSSGITITYGGYIQGDHTIKTVTNGQIFGTVGENKAVTSFQAIIPEEFGSIEYKAHVSNKGWDKSWTSNGEAVGLPNEDQKIQALQIRLKGDAALQYDLYYRVYSESLGWLDWSKNGDTAGTTGLGKNIQAVQITTVQKDAPALGNTDNAAISAEDVKSNAKVSYSVHGENYGWSGGVMSSGQTAGQTGKGLRLEALKISIPEITALGGNSGVSYQTHSSNLGWTGFKENGAVSGTEGQGLAVQAVQIQLTGRAAQLYNIYYRVHIANYGWLDWTSNGNPAGSTELNLQAEAIEIVVSPKGSSAPGSTERPYLNKTYLRSRAKVDYQTHVTNIGWQTAVSNGDLAGTTGQGLSVQAIAVNAPLLPKGSGITYRVFIQDIGWQDRYLSNGNAAGTVGQNKQLEAIVIELTGEAKQTYDVYYQVHSEDYGWLDWAKNGAWAGTTGGARRMEAIRIKLVLKGDPAPGPTDRPYAVATPKPVPQPGVPGAPVNGNSVLVDINSQNLYYYVNNSCVLQTPVTTGMLGRYDTPRGSYSLLSKSTNVSLVGSGYVSHVNFWMPFIGQEYGLHDADEWRSNYGGDVYTYDGSHGCVNMPYQAAASLYRNIAIGTPIIVR